MRTVLFFLLLFIFSIVVNTSVLNSFASQSKSTHLLEHHPEITTEFESELEHKKLHQLPSHDQSCEDACHCNCNQCFSPLIAFHSLALENINSQIICFDSYPTYLTPSIQNFQSEINRPPKA